MYRLPALAAAVMWMVTTTAQAECRREIVTCESACPDLQDEAETGCMERCRSIIICEAEPRRSAKSRLPDSTLPSDRLPRNRLPTSQLPDSFLN